MGTVRITLAVVLLVAFLFSYSLVLWNMGHTFIADPYDMQRYLIRIHSLKTILFSVYIASNCIMTRSCHTQFENEILLTGIFSIIFISVTTALHYTHLLIMPTQWNLILFNGTTIAFFLLVYIGGLRHGNFTDE